MVIGTIKEIKDNENRVGLTPNGVRELVKRGHRVFVQRGAGEGSGFSDEEYREAGAKIHDSAVRIVKESDILVKVKEPLPEEYYLLDLFKEKTLYTYLHLSGVLKSLTEKLLENKITGIAYETVTSESGGRLPLLLPMSEVAGVLAVQYGAQYSQRKYRGRGLTLGTIANTDPAQVVVVGGGIVGKTAARTAAGMGAKVAILDINQKVLDSMKKEFRRVLGSYLLKNVEFVLSTQQTLMQWAKKADVLIGAVLVAGARAPIVVTEEMVKAMQKGAVIVDVSIDQGGCVWGSRATSHTYPTYELEGKIYCCVANMPGQVAHQSTQALTSATLPYLIEIAKQGILPAIRKSLKGDKGLANGVNTFSGHITYKPVAVDLKLEKFYTPLSDLLPRCAITKNPRSLNRCICGTAPVKVQPLQENAVV